MKFKQYPNVFEVDGKVGRLIITRQDKSKVTAFFDAEDLELVRALQPWRLLPSRKGCSYVCRNSDGLDGKIDRNKLVLLHRLVMRTPEDLQCKSYDGNGLNCRKANLKNTTHDDAIRPNLKRKAKEDRKPYPRRKPKQ